VDDLDFGLRDVTFDANVLNKFGTFDWIANRSMENLSYAYLHYDLLERTTLIIIIFRVKLSHIYMFE
jgi:hypothetical protein